mmetsp:Transcript_39675/g.113127  ORF Transcript_39675/g.113127 Transcript_39675/m.113127 type:complete len:252 (+) Transcript_39675:110-865(+)
MACGLGRAVWWAKLIQANARCTHHDGCTHTHTHTHTQRERERVCPACRREGENCTRPAALADLKNSSRWGRVEGEGSIGAYEGTTSSHVMQSNPIIPCITRRPISTHSHPPSHPVPLGATIPCYLRNPLTSGYLLTRAAGPRCPPQPSRRCRGGCGRRPCPSLCRRRLCPCRPCPCPLCPCLLCPCQLPPPRAPQAPRGPRLRERCRPQGRLRACPYHPCPCPCRQPPCTRVSAGRQWACRRAACPSCRSP